MPPICSIYRIFIQSVSSILPAVTTYPDRASRTSCRPSRTACRPPHEALGLEQLKPPRLVSAFVRQSFRDRCSLAKVLHIVQSSIC